MSENKYGNFRNGLQTKTTCYKRFSHSFCYVTFHAKTTPENVASSRILTKMAASLFRRIYKAISNNFAVIYR